MSMEITVPGGLAVEAQYKGFRIATDQPREVGGQGTAPAPFDLFLASLGTCAGLYALRFCQERGLSTEGLRLDLAMEKDAETRRLRTIRITVQLPAGFPEKYETAIERAVNLCAVKRAIAEPPELETVVLAPVPAVVAAV
jgi:ribosomal protein S12 methylthiotransferase accessory factor